ncbi:hypothetical protein BHE74_00027035 [Ensete ventricosum]|nr:hypothetical protein GW17_00043731 [Ensete ventricosum]RWW65645.1 hypothetical protein BHE74_00027035 [Ensete ventricosum]RZS06002.1 hypothetical protein BHM03_00036582 [Ensete ventricosum]
MVEYSERSTDYRSVAFASSIVYAIESGRGKAMANAGGVAFRWVLQLHRDVPRAARFYSEGLDFSVSVCTLRWAELQSGPLKLALMHSPRFRSVTIFLFEYSLTPFWSDPCAMRSSTMPSYFADQLFVDCPH